MTSPSRSDQVRAEPAPNPSAGEGKPVAERQKRCRRCDGTGQVLLMNSWFTSDGYRREQCGICAGSGVNPPGYTAWPGDDAFRKRALANIKAWGGLVPRGRALASRPVSGTPDGAEGTNG